MKSIIIVYSYHHKNTEKLAYAMADRLEAAVQYPENTDASALQEYDLLGFGAGIDSGKHYAQLLTFAGELPETDNKKAFIFSTCGVGGKKKMYNDHKALRDILTAKGYNIVDEFSCVGYNTNSFLKYFGGLNKNRPNAEDLQKAADFAEGLLK